MEQPKGEKIRGKHLLGDAKRGIIAGCPDSSTSNPYASPLKERLALVLYLKFSMSLISFQRGGVGWMGFGDWG